MATITMQGIAALARVKRPVVSTWRRRFANGPARFPDPVDAGALTFDAEEVARWLVQTGHGNNADAEVEAHLHSTTFSWAQEHLPDVSALLLLSHVTGVLARELDEFSALSASYDHGLDSVLDDADVSAALREGNLCETADLLAEAAFSPGVALLELHEAALATDSFWRPEALTQGAYGFLGGALATPAAGMTQVRVSSYASIPLATSLARQMASDEGVSFRFPESATCPAPAQLAQRLLAARVQATTDDADGPVLWLHADTSTRDEEQFFDGVEDVLLSVTPKDHLVVIGPAQFMMDEAHAVRRRSLLLPQLDQVEPLRFVAELPRACSRFHPRRRLALWVFGAPKSAWTVVADLVNAQLGAPSAESLGGDILAALSGGDSVRSRAFSCAQIRATDRLVRMDSLNLVANQQLGVTGGERLARIWELDHDGWADGFFVNEDGRTPQVSLPQAIEQGLLLDLPGARLPADLVGCLEPGGAPVLGTAELQGSVETQRGINRLDLERVAPQAQLTQPGDVVYTAGAAPAAVIHFEGGCVIQAPARVLRCRTDVEGDRVLSPHIVALDVPRQVSPNRRLWLLRTVSPKEALQIDAVATAADSRLEALRQQLRDLEEVRTEMLDGLGDGTLVAGFVDQYGSPVDE